MKLPWIIKCNCGYMRYLYWNGVAWTAHISSARNFDSKKDAEKELKDLSPPRNCGPGRGPEVMTFDLNHNQEG